MPDIVWLAVAAVVLCVAAVACVFVLPWLGVVLGECAVVCAVLSLRSS